MKGSIPARYKKNIFFILLYFWPKFKPYIKTMFINVVGWLKFEFRWTMIILTDFFQKNGFCLF